MNQTIQQVLSPQEIQQFRQAGYTDEQIQQAFNEVKEEPGSALQQSYARTVAQKQQDPRALASHSHFRNIDQENMVKWQLELDSILERVEHMLRGDQVQFKDGHILWTPATSTDQRMLNDFGVAEIMRILSMYLNRNTILSNYDEETINWKVYDFGKEVSDLIYLKYEDMGLDNLKKRKMYPILVLSIVDTVHSSYLRALHGGERDSLREARTVTQSDTLAGGLTINTGGGMPSRERSIFNPKRYLMGKYK